MSDSNVTDINGILNKREEKRNVRELARKKARVIKISNIIIIIIMIFFSGYIFPKANLPLQFIIGISGLMSIWVGGVWIFGYIKGENKEFKLFTLGSRVAIPYMVMLLCMFSLILYILMILLPIWLSYITTRVNLYFYLTVVLTLFVRFPRVLLFVFVDMARLIDKFIIIKINPSIESNYHEETDTKIIFRRVTNAHSRMLCYAFALILYALLNAKTFGMDLSKIKSLFFEVEVDQIALYKDIYKEAFLTFIIADSFSDQLINSFNKWFKRQIRIIEIYNL